MNTFKRLSAMVVIALGLAALIFGIILITQAGSAEQEIASAIKPLTIAEVDAKYETVKTKQMTIAATEEPQIQAGKAAPSATYNYLTIQRSSLGLTRANIGLAAFVRTSGIMGIIIGLGLTLAGAGLRKKSQA